MIDLAPQRLTEDAARRLTERIRATAISFTEAREKLLDLVQQAKTGDAHVALGYQSWTAYLSDTLGSEPMRLARDERRDMVRMLTDEGMSTRDVGAIVGVDQKTVVNDRRRIATEELSSVPDTPAPREVTGHDGKIRTYPTPEPAKPRAEAITSQFTGAVTDLNRLLDRFHRITNQDAYGRNTPTIGQLHKADLTRAVTELQNIINGL